MTDQDFLKALTDAPEDTFLVNVYADWLEEQNDQRYLILRGWLEMLAVVDRFAANYGCDWTGDQDFVELQWALQNYHDSFYKNRCPDWMNSISVIRPWISPHVAIQLGRLLAWQDRHSLEVQEKSLRKTGSTWRLQLRSAKNPPSDQKRTIFRTHYGYIERTYGVLLVTNHRRDRRTLPEQINELVNKLFGA